MSKVQQIEAAIQQLSKSERAELVEVLPKILPELDGDAEWERIIRSDEPRPAFSKYVDELEADLAAGKLELRETSEEEFRKYE